MVSAGQDETKVKEDLENKRKVLLEQEESQVLENEKMDKANFLICLARMCKETDHPDELIACFEMFDEKKSGFVSEHILRYILCNMGDKFADDEIDLFMKECANFLMPTDPNDPSPVKMVNYRNFALHLKDLFVAG